jgi:hypothetical protein
LTIDSSTAFSAGHLLLLASALTTCRGGVGAIGAGVGSRTGASIGSMGAGVGSRTGARDVGLTGAGVGLTGAMELARPQEKELDQKMAPKDLPRP